MEEYKTIKGFENYEISNTGKIREKVNDRILDTFMNKGYTTIGLRIDGKRYIKEVHRLVAQTFILEFNNKSFVYHIDGNKNNNVVSNLKVSNNKLKSKNKEKTEVNLMDFEKLELKRGKGELSYDEQLKLIEMYKQIDKNKAKERTREWRLKKTLMEKIEGIEKDDLEVLKY